MSTTIQSWQQRNALTLARDRHRMPPHLDAFRTRQKPETSISMKPRTLGDVHIFEGKAGIPLVAPLVTRMQKPMVSHLVRRMGETTVDQIRATYGSPSLWNNTPVEELSQEVGDPDLADAKDITGILADFERVGWSWSKASNTLNAFLTTAGQTYLIRLPLKKIQAIFNRSHCDHTGEKIGPYKEKTLDGFFKKLGRKLKKAVKGVVKNTVKSITAPVRFFKNPKKFVKDTANHIKRTVKGVGKTALKVASSPIFAGVMTAVSAIPPLTAVGAAGLAAYAAANAIKPAFKLAEKGIDTVDALSRKRKQRDIKANINALPPKARRLMGSALKSTSAKSLGRGASKAAFRFAGGALQKLF